MSDLSIRNDFLEGIQEVFSTLFNEGVSNDGIQLFQYSGGNDSIYQENKYKKYANPMSLVSSVRESENEGTTDIEVQKRKSIFKVPTQSLLNNGIKEMNKSTVAELKKGIIKYKDIFYYIDLIQGSVFVENIYSLWEFQCTEIFDDTDIFEGYSIPVASNTQLGGVILGSTLDIDENGVLYSRAFDYFSKTLIDAKKICS